MTSLVRINCWSVVKHVDADDFKGVNYPLYYKVWEEALWDVTNDNKCLKLCGDIYGHPNHYDLTRVITSAIINVENDRGVVTTKSGTRYVLDKVDNLYIDWLELRNSSEKALKGRLLHVPTYSEPFKIVQ